MLGFAIALDSEDKFAFLRDLQTSEMMVLRSTQLKLEKSGR